MPDFRQQFQKHYEAKELPAVKAESILAEGRAVAAAEKIVPLPRRKSTVRWAAWAVAASIVILAGLAVWWRSGVSYQEFAPQVVAFFRQDPELPKRSQNPQELREWLLTQGAPADFQIPPNLMALKSFGCQVINVEGKTAYLTCFWSEKKPGVDQGSLVHLLVARRSDFKNAPSGTPEFREIGAWSFAAWSEKDVIYTLAAKAPLEKLKPFVSRLWTGRAVAVSCRDAAHSARERLSAGS